MEPTAAQARAATTLDRHLAVTAGPGSGKTRVLVSRYLTILERHAGRVENIVAITFTNKAANEMRERLRKEIDRKIEGSRRTAHEPFWRESKRRLESAVITTIHGFCSRILRESPVEAVVDPQFATLDDYSASVMLDASAQAAVAGLIDRDDDAGARLVAAYTRPALVAHLVAIYNALRGAGVSLEEAERKTTANLLDAGGYALRLAEVDVLLEEAYAILANEKGASRATAVKKIDALADAWRNARVELEATPTVESSFKTLAALRRVQLAAPTRTIAAPLKPWVNRLKAILGEKPDAAAGSLELAFWDVAAAPYAPILFRTLRSLDALYTIEKRNASALDYEDLQLRVRDLLTEHPEVARRLRGRYRYFLVDEFQDTNNLQREIVNLIALGEPAANLFVVGDRKQSVYGFRGAEVEVFAQTIRDLVAAGGESVALSVNFRSDARLVGFFNCLFERVMRPEPGDDPRDLEALGFVAHEASEPHRTALDEGPVVELLLDVPAGEEVDEEDGAGEEERERPREREARRLAARIRLLVESGEASVSAGGGAEGPPVRPPSYGDIAILMRAMTDSKIYERALRQAGVPYYVVAGKGFYDRPETRDILTLLEFVDNRSDERALAAVLRSPLFGVSDEALLALRAARLLAGDGALSGARDDLFASLVGHRSNPLVAEEQREALDEAVATLSRLLEIRNRVAISELIRDAIRETRYDVVAAAAEDGAQRLSNLDKLVTIARAFERGAMRLLRDFIDYIRDFRRLEARESEASLLARENAVALITIHKAKGLEFPVVVLPDLQRELGGVRGELLFDRALGLGFRVPDGRGGLARTAHLEAITARRAVRDRFESMRLFYVAATRAQDLLILSGATDRRMTIDGKPLRELGSWLHWVVAATRAPEAVAELPQAIVSIGDADVRVISPRLSLALPLPHDVEALGDADVTPPDPLDIEVEAFLAVERSRRLLAPVGPSEEATTRRFAATALQSYANCERRFYYARLLRLPAGDAATASRDAGEAAERGRRLPASVRGLVIHRFCETLLPGEGIEARLRQSLRDVRTRRGDAFADLFAALDEEAALDEVEPLARNYVASRMRLRVDERLAAGHRLPDGGHELVRSELPFTLRVAGGLVFGVIDKVLLTPLPTGRTRALVVDFKTGSVAPTVEEQALEHRLQMQVYACAVRRLVPDVGQVEAVLHFLAPGPNVEYEFPAETIAESRASREIERVIAEIGRGGLDPASFPTRPGLRCRTCTFARICPDAIAG